MPTEVQAKPTETRVQPNIISARSVADEFAEAQPSGEPGSTMSEFSEQLRKAQGADSDAKRGVKPQSTSGEDPEELGTNKVESPPAIQADAKPKVPGLPEAPKPDEYRPRGDASKHWDALKTKHAEETAALKIQLDQAKAELTAAKANGSPDVENLKSELTKYREILRDVAIERDPEFKQRFAARQEAAINAAKIAAGEKSAKLEALLKSPSSQWRDEQINSLVEDLPASSQRRVNAALGILEQIDVQRETEIAERRATFDQKQSSLFTQQKEQQTKIQQDMVKTFDATLKEWTDPQKGHPFFIEREGDAEHNAGVKEGVALAKAIFSGDLTKEEIAAAALWAASGERLLKGWQSAMARADKAEKALDKLRGVQPGDGAVTQAHGSDDDESAPQPGTPQYLTWINSRLKQAQAEDANKKYGRK